MYTLSKKIGPSETKVSWLVLQLVLSYIATTALNYFIKTNHQGLALKGTPAHFSKCSDSKKAVALNSIHLTILQQFSQSLTAKKNKICEKLKN